MALERDAAQAALLSGVRIDDLFTSGVLDNEGAARAFRTPAYVYDLAGIRAEVASLREAFVSGGVRHLIAYAVKANSAGPILRAVHAEGAGADVVSGAELELALRIGMLPEDIVYSGVAKLDEELDAAISVGPRGILSLQAESIEELARIDARARALGRRARVSLRINPGIEADTHAHIATGHDEAKFGIPRADLGAALEALASTTHIDLAGIGAHVGSQLTSLDDYVASARMLIPLFATCEAFVAQHARPPLDLIDFGGGFGIDYGRGCPVRPADFARALHAEVCRAGLERLRVVVEPGRSIVGAHGVLVATVVMAKRAADRRWLMIDAGMNDLLRPALYQAFHRVEPTIGLADPSNGARAHRVVGPVCESSDDFGEHLIPEPSPTRVLLRDAGAYGFTMASEYNGRALPTEVFLDSGKVVAVIVPRRSSAWVNERCGL
ncbi:MAG: diaminopimelate decarboxylase [Polyangiaceae bacterium]